MAPEPAQPSAPSWHVAEDVWFRCPLCGMMAKVERVDDSPYPFEMKRQRYGGKLPGGAGYMEYFPMEGKGVEETKKELARKAAQALRLLQK